jgi:predicted transposase YbfD/YdcC
MNHNTFWRFFPGGAVKKTRWDDVALSGLLTQVEQVPDPRVRRKPRHLLTDILVIAICGVLSGCDGCVEIAEYGRRKEEFFRTLLELPYGIPSHDTFNRVLALLKPEALQTCLIGWLRSVRDEAGDSREERHIAIDGKSLRRTFDRAASQNMLHLVSAWSTANGLTLGQVAVDEKSNEITAIPRLLAAVDVSGATVTIDAMGCQKNIAKAITSDGGNYYLAVKGNQETTLRLLQETLAEHLESDAPPPRGTRHETHEVKHGREETREYVSLPAPASLKKLGWSAVRSIGMVHNRTIRDGKLCEESRYYISTHRPSARKLAKFTRRHWSIENSLHWVLDMSFHEDLCRLRTGHAAENLALLNRIAISLLKADQTVKAGIACKRKTAGWDDHYLIHLLLNTTST